jgi:hypothetical protein
VFDVNYSQITKSCKHKPLCVTMFPVSFQPGRRRLSSELQLTLSISPSLQALRFTALGRL